MSPHTWRRRHFRFPAKDVTVNGGAVDGVLLNVARSGLAIETTTPVQIGREYRMRVRYEDASFVATGRVRWCILRKTKRSETGENVPVYHAGFSLEERELEEQEEVLDKLRRRLLKVPPT